MWIKVTWLDLTKLLIENLQQSSEDFLVLNIGVSVHDINKLAIF